MFLTQLEQVVLGMGAPNSVQLVIQGAIIALGMALRHAPDAHGSGRSPAAGCAAQARHNPFRSASKARMTPRRSSSTTTGSPIRRRPSTSPTGVEEEAYDKATERAGLVLGALLWRSSQSAPSSALGRRRGDVADAAAGDRDGRQVQSIPFCGTKPITLAVLDGFGINAWSQESYAAVRSEAAKCSNVKVITAAGGGDLQKSISDISSSVAQGANAITVIPDFGAAELAAHPAGDGSGREGRAVGSRRRWEARQGLRRRTSTGTTRYAGTIWANWMVKALHGKGNVIYTGGPAGNPVGAAQLAAIVAVFKKHPGMKLLTGNKDWPVTNWDPATAQKVTAALLAKYPKIDGIISNYGTDAFASIRAFQAAGRKLVPVDDTRRERPVLHVQEERARRSSTISIAELARPGRGAQGDRGGRRPPERRAEPKYNLTFFEDTLTPGKALRCNPKAASDFYPSNQLTVSTIAKYGKP